AVDEESRLASRFTNNADIDRAHTNRRVRPEPPAVVEAETEGVIVGAADRQHGEDRGSVLDTQKPVGDLMDGAVAAGRRDDGITRGRRRRCQLLAMPRGVRGPEVGALAELSPQPGQPGFRLAAPGVRVMNDANLGHQVVLIAPSPYPLPH